MDIRDLFYARDGQLIQKKIDITEETSSFKTRDGLYESELKKNIQDEGSLTYKTTDGYISFKPLGLRWDTGQVIKDGINNVSAERIKDGFEIQGRRGENAKGIIYRHAYGQNSNIGVLTHTTLWRKILSLYSLEELGIIPVGAKYLEIPLEVDTNYSIPDLKTAELRVDKKIKLGENSWIGKSRVWDMQTEKDEINIDSCLKKENGKTYFVKQIPIEWLKEAIFPIFTDADITYGTASEFEAGVTTLIRCCQIDTNKFAVSYCDSGAAGYAIVGTVSGTTITWGTASSFCSDVYLGSERIGIAKLDTDKFVVVYTDDIQSDSLYGRVAEVSTRTISWGTATQLYAGNAEWADCCSLGTDAFVAAYNDETGGDTGDAKYCTVSGTTITANAAAEFSANFSTHIRMCEMASDKFVINFNDSDDGVVPKVVCGTVSGTTITFGAVVEIDADQSGCDNAVAKMDTDKFVALYNATPAKGTREIVVVPCTISTRTITAGTQASLDLTSSKYSNGVVIISTTEGFAFYMDSGDSSKGKSQKFSVNWTTTTATASGTIEEFEAGATLWPMACIVSTTALAVVFQDDDDSDKGKAVIGTFSAGEEETYRRRIIINAFAPFLALCKNFLSSLFQ